jgi:Bacterial Ig-like domain (group 2)
MTLSRIGQTVQLSATAAFSTGNQTVTAIATWQSSNTAVATVSGGLVTAVAAGAVTIAATYQGKAGTLNLTVALGSVMTAAIDGAVFNAINIQMLKTGAQIFVQGSSTLTDPHLILAIAVPPAVGTYDLESQAEFAFASLSETTTPFVWSTDVIGGSGTVTVSTLTSTSASGTFSLTLAPAQGMPTDTRVVTNGVFNLLF